MQIHFTDKHSNYRMYKKTNTKSSKFLIFISFIYVNYQFKSLGIIHSNFKAIVENLPIQKYKSTYNHAVIICLLHFWNLLLKLHCTSFTRLSLQVHRKSPVLQPARQFCRLLHRLSCVCHAKIEGLLLYWRRCFHFWLHHVLRFQPSPLPLWVVPLKT